MNLIPNCIIKTIIKPPSLTASCTTSKDEFNHRSIQVCVIGAHTNLGKLTSFLLKQNPLLSTVKLQGEKEVKNYAYDLNLIDTRCNVETFDCRAEIPSALRGADIVLILKNKTYEEDMPLPDRIESEAKRVYDIAKQCTLHASRSIIVVAVPPVSVFTPLVTNVFKLSPFYRPERIIGSVAMAQIKVNTMVGRYHALNPYVCHVPIVGGPDMDVVVPLFTKSEPVELNQLISKCMTAGFRQVKSEQFPKVVCKDNFIENHDFSEAFALNNMITTICFGLMGDKKAFYNGFVRSNVAAACGHLVTTLQFGTKGVTHNCGLPQLTNFELDLFERAILEISKREKIAKKIVDFFEGSSEVSAFTGKGKDKAKNIH